LNDKHTDKTNDRRTKVECFPVGSGSESSLLVSSRHCKRRFRFFECSCADVMTKETKNDACKKKKRIKNKWKAPGQDVISYLGAGRSTIQFLIARLNNSWIFQFNCMIIWNWSIQFVIFELKQFTINLLASLLLNLGWGWIRGWCWEICIYVLFYTKCTCMWSNRGPRARAQPAFVNRTLSPNSSPLPISMMTRLSLSLAMSTKNTSVNQRGRVITR